MTAIIGPRWWQRAVIYQVYPRSFKDSDGDGVGDLQGMIDKLDYLAGDLGVDALWLSPFYKSPMVDFGYDIADFCDVDPTFGDLATFDRLIAEAHARGLRVIVDYVPNHSSDQHPWFVESRSSRDNPKRDWYIWRDPGHDLARPNNWGSVFGGPAWTMDEETGQYYFHQFDPAQPDLNWRNPQVRAAMLDVLRFWLARGVDGFRMDVVYMVWKHPDLPDQPPAPGANARAEADLFGLQQQIYAYNYDGVHDVMRDIRATLNEFVRPDALPATDKVAIGEIWLPLAERMTYHGVDDGTGVGDEFHMPFNFDLIGHFNWIGVNPPDAARLRASVDAYEAALPPYGWPNHVLGNHDVPRLATRFGGENQARLGAMLLLTLRGTPTLYNGDELGMVNGVIPRAAIKDPQGLRLGAEQSRDQCRTPFEWDGSANAGFSPDPSVTPWLPVAPGHEARNLAAQRDDPRSIFALYRRLLALRRATPALQLGAYQPLDAPESCYVYRRTLDGTTVTVALNFSAAERAITTAPGGRVALATGLDREGETVEAGALTLRPWEGVVLV
jgi:alpha-glucosidase